jgi:hypothetical protein
MKKMAEFIDATLMDLIYVTEFIHTINPSLRDKVVVGVEESKPFDKNVVFHLLPLKQDGKEETSLFMLSAEYILEHPMWNFKRK